jgi:hypothetical protein
MMLAKIEFHKINSWNLVRGHIQNVCYYYTRVSKKPMAPTILERGLPICGLWPNHVCELVDDFFNSAYMSFETWFIFYKMDCQSNARPSEKESLSSLMVMRSRRIPSHVGISGNEVTDGFARQAVESSTVHGQMTVANDHRILARQGMVKQWQHVWRTGDTGQFPHSIRPVVSVKPWFDGQEEERRFVTTISRVMSGHCSIRAHLERYRIVGDPMGVCLMNYETVDHIIWECSRFEVENRE